MLGITMAFMEERYRTHITQLLIGVVAAQPFLGADDMENHARLLSIAQMGMIFQLMLLLGNLWYGTHVQIDTSRMLVGFAICLLPHIILPRMTQILAYIAMALTVHQGGFEWARQIMRGFVEAQ